MSVAEDVKADGKGASRRDEVALELMKYIASTTGYGKGGPATGFGKEKSARTPEEYADALLELFDRCRAAVNRPVR